jgi:sugar phosphate isomerase/epimerase
MGKNMEAQSKLAFSTLGCPELSLPQVVELASRAGYAGVELRGQGREHIDPSFSKAERAEVRRLFSARQVSIIGVTAYSRFAFLEELSRRENEEQLLACVELAAELGAPFVRTFVGAWEQGVDSEAIYQGVADSLERVALRMEGSPVTVLVETHDSVSRMGELHKILRRVPSAKIAVLWDMAHSYGLGESLEASLELIGKRLGYLHLKDAHLGPGGEERLCLPGEGEVPLRACRELLWQRGYRPWLCLEWERKWHPELPPLPEALERFKEVMGA